MVGAGGRYIRGDAPEDACGREQQNFAAGPPLASAWCGPSAQDVATAAQPYRTNPRRSGRETRRDTGAALVRRVWMPAARCPRAEPPAGGGRWVRVWRAK